MKSNYNQLGQYIEMVSRTNADLKYGIEDVRGCSNTKQMMQTRANLIGRTYEKFIVLRPQEFVFNRRTTRNGEKIGMAYNNTDREYIFTNDYVAFRVKQEYLDKLLPDYLYMFFCRDEFDRYARYKSTGSATEFFNWEDMCAVPFEIPPMDFQQLVVNAYKVLNERIETKQKINDNLEAQAEAIYNEVIANNSTNSTMSTLGEISTIKTGKLNSEAAVINGIYPFFTCSQETYRTNTFSFDQEAVLLAGNNASAIYPLKIYCGKFDVYQRTYVISSNNRFVSNKQLYFVLKQQLNEFKGISSGTTTKFLTMKILTPIPVVIAPEDIATSFINITNKIFETIFQNQREIEHLRELQMIILGELLRD